MRSFKRVLAAVLAVAMVLTTFGMVVVSAASYSDTEGHWAESYIDIWSNYGVIQGDGGYFRPDDAITRAEVAQVTQNVIGYVVVADNTFYDVPAGAWYEDAVLKLVAAGTLTGNGDGTMAPENYMTREEAMTMLARAYGLTVENTQAGITQYADYQSISDYATGYVGAMTAAGYVGGYEDGTIRPQDYISRAEFVKILDNMIKLYITAPGTYGPGYYGGIAMIKSAGVTLTGVVGGGAVISPQVSGNVTFDKCQFTDKIVNLSQSANVISNSTVDNQGTSTLPGAIMSGNGGGPSGGSNSGTNKYTVRFIVDGNQYATRTVTKNSFLGAVPSDPKKKDMTFVGWFLTQSDADEANSADAVNFAKMRISRNMNVYAGFTEKGDVPVPTPAVWDAADKFVNEDGSVNTDIFPAGSEEGKYDITPDSVKDIDGLTFVVAETQPNAVSKADKTFDDGYNAQIAINVDGNGSETDKVFTVTPETDGTIKIYADAASDAPAKIVVKQGDTVVEKEVTKDESGALVVEGLKANEEVKIMTDGDVNYYSFVFVGKVAAPTAAPTEPTAKPEEPTAAPSEPTAAPSEPTAAPEEPTVKPEEPTVAPEEPTTKPTEPTAAPTPVLYKAQLDVQGGKGSLTEANSTVAMAADLPQDQVWTIADADVKAAVVAAGDKEAFSINGLNGYGQWKEHTISAKYTHTNGTEYNFKSGWQAGSGSTTRRCFYFTPKQACIVTVAYGAQATRPVKIEQGGKELVSGEEGIKDGIAATITADIEDPTAGDVYVIGGSSNKDIFGIFVDYYDPNVIVEQTLSGKINYEGSETGLKVRFTDTKDGNTTDVNGNTYEVPLTNGNYTVNLRQNRTYDISVVDADGNVSSKVAPTLDTNSVSISKMAKTQDIDLVDIALTKVTGDVVVHDYNNDGTTLDLSKVQITFTAKDNAAYTYTTGITDNKIDVTMMPNHEYEITVTGIDGYEISPLSKSYLMAAGDTTPFKNILFTEVLGEVPFSATVKVGADKQYKMITDAIAAIEKMTRPAGEEGRVTIEIDPGIYTEQVNIAPGYVTLKAADPNNRPEIQWYYGIAYLYYSSATNGYYSLDDAVQKTKRGTVQRWGTACRPTGQYVYLDGIIIRHTFNCFVSEAELADGVQPARNNEYSDTNNHPDRTVENYDAKTKTATERAAAITLDGGYSELYNCDFISSQDTFYTNKTAYVKNCYIEGGTDFIYGGNSILFEDCTLAWHGYSDQSTGGYLTACQTSDVPVAGTPNQNTNGYLFRNCTVTTSKYYPENQFNKGGWGRNWGGAKCQVVYDGIKMEGIDPPTGWTKMGGELTSSIVYVNNVTDKNGNAVDVTTGKFENGNFSGANPNGTMEANGYTIMSDLDYFGGTWIPPHYDKEVVLDEYTTTWNFGKSNGAPDYALEGAGATVDITGESNNPEAQVLTVNAESGKFNNSTRTDEWAQVNDGTTFKIPVDEGTVIKFDAYNAAGTLTIGENAFTEAESYTYHGEKGFVTATATGVGYIAFIQTITPNSAAPTAKPTAAPADPTADPTAKPIEPTATADPNAYYFAEGTIVAFTGIPDVTNAKPKMTVTKVSDGSVVEVSADNTFVMPDGDVNVEVVYEAAEPEGPYSEWQQGQAKVDTSDGSMKVVEYEGKTALDITGRNVYTVLDEPVKEGKLIFNTNVYAGPDATGFRIYLENASALNYQDLSKAVEVINSDDTAGKITVNGWYNVDITADYEKVAGTDFITVVVKDAAGAEVLTQTKAAANGVADGIKQIRLISRGTAGESDMYFADMAISGLKPGVDDPIVPQNKAKTWVPADNYDELLSKSDGTSTTKFNISKMNMDNLLINAGEATNFGYEDLRVEQPTVEYPENFTYADGKSFPSKIFNFRGGCSMKFMPSTTQSGKLDLYFYSTRTDDERTVTISQGAVTETKPVNAANQVISVDVAPTEEVTILADMNIQFVAAVYTPGGVSEPTTAPSEPTATPSEPTIAPTEPTATPSELPGPDYGTVADNEDGSKSYVFGAESITTGSGVAPALHDACGEVHIDNLKMDNNKVAILTLPEIDLSKTNYNKVVVYGANPNGVAAQVLVGDTVVASIAEIKTPSGANHGWCGFTEWPAELTETTASGNVKLKITSDAGGYAGNYVYVKFYSDAVSPSASAEPTTAPSEPTAAPSEPTATPAEPTATPAEPTATPTPAVEAIDIDVDLTNQSTNHTFVADTETTQWGNITEFGVNALGNKVAADAEDAVMVFSGFRWHSDDNGVVPGTVTIKVNGPVKVLVGNNANGNTVTLTDPDGNVSTADINVNPRYVTGSNNVQTLWYGGGAGTLTLTGGGYVPYYGVKTVDPSEIPATHNVTVADTSNGTVTVNKSSAMVGQKLTITATPATGYVVDTVSVKTTGGADVDVNAYVFTMPDSDVTVTVTFKLQPTQGSTIDYQLNLKPGGDVGETQQDWVLKDGFVTVKNMKSNNSHGAQGSGPITVQVPGSVQIEIGTCAYDDFKVVVKDANDTVVAQQDDILGTSQANAAGTNGTYACDGKVTLTYTGGATTLTISFEKSTNGAQANARFWLPFLNIKSI